MDKPATAVNASRFFLRARSSGSCQVADRSGFVGVVLHVQGFSYVLRERAVKSLRLTLGPERSLGIGFCPRERGVEHVV